MYEKITSYLDFFENSAVSEAELNEKIKQFSDDFMQSGFMNPNGMEAMGERVMAGKSQLKNDALTMSAEEICNCLSAFVQQDAFIPGIVLDLVQQGVVPQMLKRLKELEA